MAIKNGWRIGLLPALCLLAADPAWKTKPAAQWTEEDARQVLSASPWSRDIVAGVARRMNEDELREAGQMGQPRGIGYDGVDPKGSGPKLPAYITSGGPPSARSQVQSMKLHLRWESAQPVRIAELKAHEDSAACEKGSYCVAVLGIPGGPFGGDPAKLGEPLKQYAALKREGQPDARPYAAAVLSGPGGASVVYFFPSSAEIKPLDAKVTFEAHIGRLFVSESFRLPDMIYLGKLDL